MAKEILGVTMRWLDGDDLDALEPILKARGQMSLNPETSRAIAAYDSENKLIAFNVLQLVPHPEPLYVDPSWRGSGLAEELAEQMYNFLQVTDTRGFMLVADSPAAVRLAEAHGMRRIESPVYIKVNDGSGV